MTYKYSDPIGPSGRLAKITKTDNTDLAGGVTRALWVGTAGTVNVRDEHGTDHTDLPLQAGLNPFRVIRVETGGTADDIWALY